jgi:hypothetical protein
MKDGHLFLSLMADGGIYEFEPISREGSVEGRDTKLGESERGRSYLASALRGAQGDNAAPSLARPSAYFSPVWIRGRVMVPVPHGFIVAGELARSH